MTPMSDGYESGSSLSDSHHSCSMGKRDLSSFYCLHSDTSGFP